MKERSLKAALEKALSGGRNNKILRFLLGCLGGTPWVGGAFGAIATACTEGEQTKINILLHEALQVHDDRIAEADKTLLALSERKQWVAAYIKFNPNQAEFIDSSNVSSLNDNGNLDFSINFSSPLRDGFTLQYFGSGEVQLNGIVESKHSVRVRFAEPCPDMVTFIFFNFDLGPDARPVLPADAL